MNCPEAIDVMGDAVEGCLEPTLHASFHEHMEECPSCRTYFEQLRVTRKVLQSLPLEGATSPRRDELLETFREEFEEKNP